jgi:hypothetical protein
LEKENQQLNYTSFGDVVVYHQSEQKIGKIDIVDVVCWYAGMVCSQSAYLPYRIQFGRKMNVFANGGEQFMSIFKWSSFTKTNNFQTINSHINRVTDFRLDCYLTNSQLKLKLTN